MKEVNNQGLADMQQEPKMSSLWTVKSHLGFEVKTAMQCNEEKGGMCA